MISTRDGRTFCARFVILGPGPLSNPKIPDFEGRDTFEGHSFHSNAWDHDYDLAGKRVAVIGSGASAAQRRKPPKPSPSAHRPMRAGLLVSEADGDSGAAAGAANAPPTSGLGRLGETS